MRLEPSEACAATLRSYRLLCRQVPGGVKIYSTGDDIVPLFDETEPLTFSIFCSDPSLPSYTEMKIPVTNRDENLSRSATGGANPGLKSAKIYYYSNINCKPGDKLYKKPGVHIGVQPRRMVVSQLEISQRPRMWGMVEIYLREPAQLALSSNGVYPIARDGTSAPQQFQIMLNAFCCEWRYYIVAQSAAPSGVVITHDRRNDTNKRPAGRFVPLPNPGILGEPLTIVFVSKQHLPLLAQPDPLLSYIFQSDGPGMARGSDLPLPYAGTLQLARDPRTGGLRADMYVYI